jgi:uncharacterized membrane protein
MIRTAIFGKGDTDASGFRIRGTEVSRLEGLSDGVFALAMTLLIVSVEVPKSFDQLLDVVMVLPVFAVSFATLMWFWSEHHQFFRRYGLNDSGTIVLNSVLLFVVLFYVYPLKFLMMVVLQLTILGGKGSAANTPVIEARQVPQLYLLYGLGFASVALVFFLMHGHALRRRGQLQLSDLELLLTRAERARNVGLMAIATLSIVLAYTLPLRLMAWPGIIYSVVGVSEWFFGERLQRKAKRLHVEPDSAEAAAAGAASSSR